jgi:hypothetical protein
VRLRWSTSRASRRRALDRRVAGRAPTPPPDADVRNLELAADLWYSIRRHWCLEGQRAQSAPLEGRSMSAMALKGRLNLFQAAMLRWRASYPYNAVARRGAAGPSTRALSQAVDAISPRRDRQLALDGERRRYDYVDGPATPTSVFERRRHARACSSARWALLNGRFGDDGSPFAPLRFFAVDSGASFHLGVAYDHFIAGGDSVVALLKAIAARYDGSLPADNSTPDIYPRTYAKLFAQNAPAFYIGQYLLPGMLLRAGRAFRPLYPHGGQQVQRVHLVRARAARARGRRARRESVGRHAQRPHACDDAVRNLARGRAAPRRGPAQPDRDRFGHQPARPDRGGPAPRFGQFLSSFLVSHPVPRTSRSKRWHATCTRKPSASSAASSTCRPVSPCVRRPCVAIHDSGAAQADGCEELSRVGRLSALNVEAIWKGVPGNTPVLHYLRAVSTGPVAPIVVAPRRWARACTSA